jgi:hypothetical protein
MENIGTFFMEFFDFLIWYALAYMIASIAFGLLEAWLLHRLSRGLGEELNSVGQALDEERLIALTVEVDHNQYFCYNSITKDFVCQGRDLKEIRERFRARYPDKDAAIYDGDETAVATLKSQLKDLKTKGIQS